MSRARAKSCGSLSQQVRDLAEADNAKADLRSHAEGPSGRASAGLPTSAWRGVVRAATGECRAPAEVRRRRLTGFHKKGRSGRLRPDFRR